MALKTWTGAVSSVWSNTSNWQGGLIPTDGDSITTVTSPPHLLTIDQPSMTFENVSGTLYIKAGTYTGHVDINGLIYGGHFQTVRAASAGNAPGSPQIVFAGLAELRYATNCDFQGGLILGDPYLDGDYSQSTLWDCSLHEVLEARGAVMLNQLSSGPLNLQFFDCTILVTGRLCMSNSDEAQFAFNGDCSIQLTTPDAQCVLFYVPLQIHRADELRGITTQIPAFPSRQNLS